MYGGAVVLDVPDWHFKILGHICSCETTTTMSEPLFMLAAELPSSTAGTLDQLLRSDDEIRAAYRQHRRSVWVSGDGARLLPLVGADPRHRRGQRLLVLAQLGPARRQLLEALFQRVVARAPGLILLPDDELLEVLCDQARQDLLIGGVVDAEALTVVLLRGNLEPLVVPLGWFTRRPGGPTPDPDDLEIIDGGQTIRLGKYEAAADALLYEVDADYRKRARQRELSRDDSFGGSLKRLRLLRGLKRADFDGVSAKEIARLERGEISKPHDKTIQLLAHRLGVSPDEIATY